MKRTQLLNPDYRGNYSNIEEMLLDKGFVYAGKVDNEDPKILIELCDYVRRGKIADWRIVPSNLAKDGIEGTNEEIEERKCTHTLYIRHY